MIKSHEDARGKGAAAVFARWKAGYLSSLEELFRGSADEICDVKYTREQWCEQRAHLQDVGLDGIKKAVRRALDSVREPDLIAVGFIDAWYGWKQWDVGVRLAIAGVNRSDIISVFPPGSLNIQQTTDPAGTIAEVSEQSFVPKILPALEHQGKVLGIKRRAEYVNWLEAVGTSRCFRYGCDRYFNRLKKTVRCQTLRPRKRHPTPFWLERFQYGNHEANCSCEICTKRKNC